MKKYVTYKYYLFKNKLKDTKETYAQYLRETTNDPEWLIKAMVNNAYVWNTRFCEHIQ